MNLFDTNGFPPRWECGSGWEDAPWVGWLHILSDLVIFMAYFAVPIVVMYFVRQKDDLKFPPIFYAFLGMIFFSCGLVHLIEAGIFWWPVYKLSGVTKMTTAGVSAAGVFLLAKILPTALDLKSGAAYAAAVKEREKAQEQLRYEQFLLRTMMRNLPDLIYFKDKDSRFTRVSDAMAEFFGVDSPEALIGKTDSDFFPKEFAGEARADEVKLMESGKALVGKEEAEHTADGKEIWLSATKLPLRDDSGEVIGMFGLSRDITPQKQAAEVMEVAKMAAEEANRSKSEFLANMSHEIRTPMNGIIGMTELLLATKLKKQQREYVDLISQSSQSLLTIITDILDFSKIEAGKLHLDPHEFDLRDSIGDTLQTLRIRADEKQLELAYQVQNDVPNRLMGDLGRIRQVLVNLVGNALKFTEAGEVVVDVRLEEQTKETVLLHFIVQDTGIGIEAEKLERIFESFTQAESSTTRHYGGTGLGLAISKKLVEMMDGRIWCESVKGDGSTFHFTVLLGLSADQDEESRLPLETLHGLSVLIVDDNATNRRILEDTLLSWEMKPLSAESGADGLAKLKDASVQLILLDHMMPGMDGAEFARKVGEKYGDEAPEIIVLTSSGQPLRTKEAHDLGISRVLNKPVKQSDLLDAIGALFGTTNGDAEETAALSEEGRPAEVAPMHVLLAEDGRVNQLVATKMLEKRGHSVVVAEDGQLAIECLEREAFDAILMDVQMPKVDGFDATRIIREAEEQTGEHIPIIAMTANAMKGDREKCIEAGMDDYVAKPVKSEELFGVLEKYAPNQETEGDTGA